MTADIAELKVLEVCESWRKGSNYVRFAIALSDISDHENESHYTVTFISKTGSMFNHYVIADLQSDTVILFEELLVREF